MSTYRILINPAIGHIITSKDTILYDGCGEMGSNQLLRDMGTRICARRKELHLTQEQVAERMNVSLQMVSNLELGKKAIRPENLLRLCQALDISADYILSGHFSVPGSLDISNKFLQLSPEHQHIIRQLIESLVQDG